MGLFSFLCQETSLTQTEVGVLTGQDVQQDADDAAFVAFWLMATLAVRRRPDLWSCTCLKEPLPYFFEQTRSGGMLCQGRYWFGIGSHGAF
jgi:hypothetical protein